MDCFPYPGARVYRANVNPLNIACKILYRGTVFSEILLIKENLHNLLPCPNDVLDWDEAQGIDKIQTKLEIFTLVVEDLASTLTYNH